MRITTTITLEPEVLQEAKGRGINVSNVCNLALKAAIGKAEPKEKKFLVELLQHKRIEAIILEKKIGEVEKKEKEQLEEIERKLNQCVLCDNDLRENKKLFASKWICHNCFHNLTPMQMDMLRK